METVGFIGLGNMGSGMAGNIQKADYPMVVYDIRQETMQAFAGQGARVASSRSSGRMTLVLRGA